ncbi:prolyl oligopeptidase family serine peptidase [Pectobacterium jejuense]|uniref:prolyl oligopeptidase family serine peptidase n=1 Tax=Pectobacterium jejuense TaxID=2974022 RepID=UPI0037F823F2
MSAGGQNAMAALLFHPEFYNVAVADSGSHDNRMDKIWWNEQWMGWPVDERYADSSNAENAWRLQGNLLLMVGELDENVDPSTTMQVVDKLIKADKAFDLFYLPGGGHGVSCGAYGQRLMWDFFIRHLAGRKTPDWNRPVQEKPPVR